MRPNWFDWLIYRLFHRRWNPIFRSNRWLRRGFVECWNGWHLGHLDKLEQLTVRPAVDKKAPPKPRFRKPKKRVVERVVCCSTWRNSNRELNSLLNTLQDTFRRRFGCKNTTAITRSLRARDGMFLFRLEG